MEMKEQHDELDKVQVGGCMAGFFNIFDRPQLLSPKRISSSSSSSSPVTCQSAVASPSKDSTRSPLTFAQGSNNKSPWRFSKEAPRLSLDSRAVVNAKGSLKPRQMGDRGEGENQRGSPGVIARLMGLEEPLPALQRSASESRVSRFVVDTFNFQNPVGGQRSTTTTRAQPARANRRRKSFFDSADFFPEPRQFDDLETLKQLLEALRLKGLLHSSNKRRSGMGNRNLVFDNHQSPPIKLAFGIRSGPGAGRRRTPERQQRRVSPLPWRRPEPLQTRASEEVNKQTIVQIWNVDEYNRQGKTLLERCDKLLHSIAEMAASEAGDSQPSPVSVLDASLYHEDSAPSPVMKRSLDFEDESWGGSNSMVSVSPSEEYVYISDILRASDCLPQESDIFSLLEKHQYLQRKHNTIPHERRLIFDAVQEIVDRIRRLPPWRRAGEDDGMMQEEIWSEFQKMRNTRAESSAEDLVGYVCGVIGRDLSEDRWQDCEVEMSEAVLDLERLIFKDLIADTIRHLAALNRSHSLRRRLVFF